MIVKYSHDELKKLWRSSGGSRKGENGQVTIIGGSKLFHGVPMLVVRAASRIVDMVYFSSPEADLEKITAKASLGAFIWVPWKEIDSYVIKSEAVLIGSGMMRYSRDGDGELTRSVTKYFLQKYPEKKWVIDGGSLQVIGQSWIPKKAVLTCNTKEYEMLFGNTSTLENNAKKYDCIIVHKSIVTYVTDGETTYEIEGGNAGLTKGGTGDVQAGLTVGLLAKNEPLLAAATAAYLIKKTAEELEKRVGLNFNADDVSEKVFEVMHMISA